MNLKFSLAYVWIDKKGVAFVIVLICWLKVLSGFTNREESFGSKITKLREEEREAMERGEFGVVKNKVNRKKIDERWRERV